MTLGTVLMFVLGVALGVITGLGLPGAIERQFTLKRCVNCHIPANGCLCVYCLRAVLVPLVIAELVHMAFKYLRLA